MPFEPHDAFKEKPPKEEELADHRQKGNEAFKAGKYDDAIKHYDDAIALDVDELYPSSAQAALFSNRAACWASKQEFAKALADADKCTAIDPKFVKAYARKGHALFHLERLKEAERAYMDGLKIDEANEACKNGLVDCQALQDKLKRKTIMYKASKISRRFISCFEGLAEMKMGQAQTGILFIVIGLLIGAVVYMYRPTSGGASSSIKLGRRFRKIDGYTLSYLEAGVSSQLKLLLLHRTSLSAEAEFGSIIPQLFTTAAIPGGLKVVAPDRLCHGYSLCPETGEPLDFTLFARILSERPAASKFGYVTSGREAARHALDIVQRRGQAAQMILFRPQMVDPSSEGLRSPLVAAESMRWALLGGKRPSTAEDEGQMPPVAQMPKDCAVMLIYLKGDVEDTRLKAELEALSVGVSVEIRYLDSFEDGLVSAASDMFGGRSRAVSVSETKASVMEPVDDDDEPSPSPWWSQFSKDKIVSAARAGFGKVNSLVATMFRSGQEEEEW